MNNRLPGKYLLLGALLAAAGCGGDANTGSNGTGSVPMATVASGPVTSLGPMGIAGARMEEANTQVLVNTAAARPATDLRLGMLTDASGLVTPSNATGTAATAVAQSVVKGPVTAIDAASRTLRVMGVAVRVDQNTLLDEVYRLEDIGIGAHVEVHGVRLPQGAGTLATRLIYDSASPPSAAEILGTVSDFSAGPPIIATSGPQVDFTNAQFSSASPAGLEPVQPGIAALPPGGRVRVSGTYDPASGRLGATRVTNLAAPERPEGRLVYVEGFVLSQTSTGYNVGDVFVDTTAIARPLAVGSRVQLRGVMASGSLRVEQVTEIAPGTRIEYVVEGTITSFATIADFRVRGERIDGSQATLAGTASSLGQGRRVRVKGFAGPGRLTATEVTVLN
jgi:hypothetical protein